MFDVRFAWPYQYKGVTEDLRWDQCKTNARHGVKGSRTYSTRIRCCAI